MKKRAISIFLSLAMMLGIVPAATVPVTVTAEVTKNFIEVELMARYGRDEWTTNALPYRSTDKVKIETNTEDGQTHKLTMNISGGETDLVSLTLRPAGASFCGECNGFGGISKTDGSPEECDGCNATYGDFLPFDSPDFVDYDAYMAKFGKAVIRYTSVKINDEEALLSPVNAPLLSLDRDTIGCYGHADADIWNGWYMPAQRLKGDIIDRVEQVPPPKYQYSFALKPPPGSAQRPKIQKIEAEFEVYLVAELVDGEYKVVYPEPEFNRETNGVSLFLGAREALDWRTNPEFWKSNSQRITKDGEYEFEIDFTAKDSTGKSIFPAPVDRLASLALMSHGATFDEGVGFLLNARKAPTSWIAQNDEGGVTISIEEVKINSTSVANTWGENSEIGDGKDIMVIPTGQGYEPTEEYVNVELWNGWASEDETIPPNRYLDHTSTGHVVHEIDSPVKNADAPYPGADETVKHFALGDARTANANPNITYIYIKVKIEGIDAVAEKCPEGHVHEVKDDDGNVLSSEEIIKPCYKCPETSMYCPGNCGQIRNLEQNPPCACNNCQYCGGPTPCLNPACPSKNKVKLGILTDKTGKDETPDIFDALEILKYLVGMEGSIITKAGATPEVDDNMKKAGTISEDGKEKGEPTIFCALEVLKYLVNMDSELKDLYPAKS